MIPVSVFKTGPVPSPMEGVQRGVLTAGQYAGLTYEQALENDAAYCDWYVNNLKDGDIQGKAFVDWLNRDDRISKKRARDEDDDAPSQNKRGCRVGFGKHREKTIGQVVDEHPDYCVWMLDNMYDKPVSGNMRVFADYVKTVEDDVRIRSKASDDAPSPEDRLSFGKHKGKSYFEVMEFHTGYCITLMDTQRDNPSSKEAARFIKFLESENIRDRTAIPDDADKNINDTESSE